MWALSVGVLFGFGNILDNIKSQHRKNNPIWASWRLKALRIEPDDPEHFATHLSLRFLCLALSTCLTKLSSLKCVDSVANTVNGNSIPQALKWMQCVEHSAFS